MRVPVRNGRLAIRRPCAAADIFRTFVRAAVAAMALPVLAVELPPPGRLESEARVPAETVEVVEPHASSPGHELRISYRGFGMTGLLTRLFGERWKIPGTEVVFFSRDGYRSGVDSGRFLAGSAWLAVSRADGRSFTVDNPSQHESGVALGPYYLIWDNLHDPAARAQGAYGWPYQVVRIDLATPADYAAARPQEADTAATEGFKHARKYCLTCHRVAGIGGEKFPADLREISRPLSDQALKSWIIEPQKMRPGTSMPPLDVLLPEAERNRTADAIVRYLRTKPATDITRP